MAEQIKLNSDSPLTGSFLQDALNTSIDGPLVIKEPALYFHHVDELFTDPSLFNNTTCLTCYSFIQPNIELYVEEPANINTK